MTMRFTGFALSAAAALLYTGAAFAGPTHDPYPTPAPVETSPVPNTAPFTHDVMCHDVLCGTMKIDTYKPAKFTQDGVDFVGAEISGAYTNITGKVSHYVQVVKSATMPPKWIDPANTTVPVPFVDTPPGGYQGQPFDYKPYYDEGEFPQFFDSPASSLGLIQAAPGKTITVEFETWLVCVLDETTDDVANTAKGDTYSVATLLGWEWGYTASYNGAGNVADPANYTSTVSPFSWVTGTPTAQWFAALDDTYGAGANTDWFNVNVGDCDNCLLPEPDGLSLWIASFGSFIAIVAVRRRYGMQRAAA